VIAELSSVSVSQDIIAFDLDGRILIS